MSAEPRISKSPQTGVVDVSGLRTARVREYAEQETNVYFERKGGRTFLVTE